MSSRSKTSLFLIELVIMILFFSLSAAVCLRIFASAQTASDYSRNLSSACLNAQSAAECYKSVGGDMKQSAQILKGFYSKDTITVYYDKNWETASEDMGAFALTMSKQDGCAVINVGTFGQTEPLFSITVKAVSDGD